MKTGAFKFKCYFVVIVKALINACAVTEGTLGWWLIIGVILRKLEIVSTLLALVIKYGHWQSTPWSRTQKIDLWIGHV